MGRLKIPARRLALTGLVASAVAALIGVARSRQTGGYTSPTSWRFWINSHEDFRDDQLDSLGYDWSRIADPDASPRHPLTVYLPQTTDDVVRTIKDVRARGETLTIRGMGHSSNDLVVANRGSVMLTRHLNQILDLDEAAMTVTVQAGLQLASLDDYVARRGLGLPVVGDHDQISAGGFASVGGASPASHRHGLFIDNVERFEYVTWAGEVATCSRTENPAQFYRVLGGLGRYGVITTLTCRVISIDKYGTILENDRTFHMNLDRYLEAGYRAFANPGAAVMLRSLWIDLALPAGGAARLGHVARYAEAPQGWAGQLGNAAWYTVMHRMGYLSGRLPPSVDRVLKHVAVSGMLFAPRYASIKNVEVFTNQTIDYCVGDANRWLSLWVPLNQYARLVRAIDGVIRESLRRRYAGFTYTFILTEGGRSEYLARASGDASQPFCTVLLIVGYERNSVPAAVLDELISRLDDICIERGAFRYMQTRTVKDPDRVKLIDPNARFSDAPSADA